MKFPVAIKDRVLCAEIEIQQKSAEDKLLVYSDDEIIQIGMHIIQYLQNVSLESFLLNEF